MHTNILANTLYIELLAFAFIERIITMKKIFIALCVAISINMIPIMAFAAEPEHFLSGETTFIQENENSINEATIKRVNTVCAGLPYHKMRSHGWGTVTLSNGSKYIDHGALWQCDNCHLILVTEGDYVLGRMETIGRWATLPYSESVSSTITYINPPANYGYTSNNYLDGYKFFIN